MSEPRMLNRDEWTALRPSGEEAEGTVRVRRGSVDFESDGGAIEASLSAYENGVDARVGYVQVFVKGTHVSVVQAHPPYPIMRWSLLWEGDLA